PKIISKDGNLIFESGANRNINIQLNGNSRLTINEDFDVLDLLQAISGAKKRTSTGGKDDEWNSGEDFVDVRQLADQLANFESRAFGRNGMYSMIREQQNRTRVSVARLRLFQRRLRTVETSVDRIKSQLEANLCSSSPCENGGTCYNTYNGFRCQCRPAFEGTKCEADVNECALYEGTDLGCQNGGQCQNQFGSFSCLCQPGWHGMHCTQRRGDCSQASSWELCGHGTCVPSADDIGYRCLCEAGWKTNGLTPLCGEDVDECSDAAAHTPCSTKCINLPGSFTCAPCAAGLTGNGVSCRDVNECETNNGGCSLNPRVDCINTHGSFHCGECPVGWQGDGRKCERLPPAANSGNAVNGEGSEGSTSIGSCAQKRAQCHPAANCFEISGTAVCTCPAGMVGTGYGPGGCVNGTANNCAHNPCLNNGICLDAGPSNFTCLCARGFRPPICEALPSPCNPNPCQNGGRCRTTDGTADGFVCQCLPGYRDRLCASRFSSCNALMSAEAGRLKYPPEGTGYEHNAQCAWVIRTNESLVLNVTFQSFDVEDTSECRFDWLQLNDGRSAAAQIIGRYCGNHLPHGGNIITSGNQLYLWFRSDNSTSRAGFDLTWTSIVPRCGGRVDIETHGTLATPGSPGNYPKNRDCRWHLVAPNAKRIKLTFFSLQLEQHDNCNFDYVAIKDLISGLQLAKFCSSGQPAPLLLPTHEAEILFHSDAEGSDTGFQLHYALEERIPGCGGVYTTSRGTISGATPPSEAGSPAMSCEYEIHLAVGDRISVSLEVQLGANDCLELWDADESGGSSLQDKICGPLPKTHPPAYTSQANRLKVKFYGTDSRFLIRYEPSCSMVLDGEEGTIISPGYPTNITQVDRLCTYTVKTAVNTVIRVQRIDYQIDGTAEDANSCLSTSLTINDGMNRAILGPFCGGKQPEAEFISQTNFLQFHLTTDADSRGRGFKFQYRSIPAGSDVCGGVHTKPGDNIRMPVDGRGEYKPDSTCYWVIVAPANKAIRLHWLSFSMEASVDCSFDFVEIYDNLDVQTGASKSEALARYCDHHLPADLVSHSRHIVVKFVSDYSDSEGGFELAYTFEDRDKCGGHIHASTGELTSPSYPMNYSASLDCDWRLTGNAGQLLEIQLEVFDLEESANCSGDYLEVRNGGNLDSVLMGRFCGRTIPTRMPSFSNEMRLVFHTDAAGSGRGFRLRWRLFSFGCGGRLKGYDGVITSPRYPSHYPRNSHCEWQITVHPGSAIAVKIEDMDLEPIYNCYYDSVKVYSGLRQTGQEPLTSLCEPTTAEIMVNTNVATIVFESDATNERRGFRISYEASCVHTLTMNYGTIESLNYMEPYTETIPINCSWTIRAPLGNNVSLEVAHLDEHEERVLTAQGVPKGPPGGLYVVDAKGVQRVVAAGVVRTEGETVTVVHNASRVSFLLDYKIDGCLSELRDESGSFQSPNHPGMYANNIECYWLINVEQGYSVELTLTDVDLEESVNCTKDALTVSDHANEAQIHERHCGSTPKIVLTSSGHRMHVRFKSDESHNGKGFVATYRSVKTTCGGKISSRNGVIQSPNYPQTYPPRSRCEWQVEVSPHHRIVFEMDDINLEGSRNCEWDYVEGFDLAEDDSEGQRLFKACKDDGDAANTWTSARNVALLRFVSDDSLAEKGFRLNFHESCGQQVTIEDTDFEYIQMARQSPRNETCLWVLQAQEASKHIIFTPTHLKLREPAEQQYATESDCLALGVKIFEGTEAVGSPRLQFCRSLPPAIISNGPSLVISVPLLLVEEFEGHYLTFDTSCGSLYTGLAGRFTSPYYPASYPANIECYWVLEASPGNSLSLTLESMDMEESEGCNRDYLEVREDSQRGDLIGVYCGHKVPATIRSKGTIWMKFKSDDDNVGEGFMASYIYEHHNELNGTEGVVESPHYPSRFVDTTNPYSYRITVDKESAVEISISHLRDLDLGHLHFYDGYMDLAPEIVMSDPEQPIWSSSNVLFFKASRGPFRLTWRSLSKEALRSNRSMEEQTRRCGDQLIPVSKSPRGFNSPGFPDGYANELQCAWNLVPENPAMHVMLQLARMDLEVFGDPLGCTADSVKISASSDLQNWSQLGKMCALPSDTGGRTFNGTPYLRVEMVTDLSVNRTGFSSLVRSVCGSEIFVDGHGEVNITDVLAVQGRQECVWKLRVRQGRRLRLSFVESQLHNDNSACNNFLLLRNGDAGDSPFLGRGKYCEDNITDVLETSSNKAYIKYRQQSVVRSRVLFRFEEVGNACSRRIHLTTGTDKEVIASPLYPNLPHPHTECIWLVTAPAHHRIMVHFQDKFDLQSSGEKCQHEFVQINDGSTEMKPELGRYCGNRNPDTIYSTGAQLRIRYFTDISEPHMGFRATLRLATCGGSYFSPEGVISSPTREMLNLHEDDGHKVRECVYTIEVEKGGTIDMRTEILNLTESQNCSTHAHMLLEEIEAFGDDGEERVSDTLSVCGNADRHLLVETNKVVIRYRMPDGLPAENQGFRWRYKMVGSRCGETITAMQGVLQTPGYPDGVTRATHCVWRIAVPKGRRVRLEILDFDNGSGPMAPRSSFRGRLTVANDFRMESVLGRYASDPPSSVLSSDNTMGVDSFLLPVGRHRGYRLRFSADGPSSCQRLVFQSNVTKELSFERRNVSQPVHCSYDVYPPARTTYLLQVKEYNTSSVMMRNQNLCSLISPLKLSRKEQTEKLLPGILCSMESLTPDQPRPSIRLPFPIELTVSGNVRNALTRLLISYSVQSCGGMFVLEPGDSLMVRQPSELEGTTGAIDCAWAIDPGAYLGGEDGDTEPQDIQLEINIEVNLPTTTPATGSKEASCVHHYLKVYSGPDQNSPSAGVFCNRASVANLVVERGLFLEYHADAFAANAVFNVSVKYGSGCGGKLVYPFRAIDFSEQYKNNMECDWEVEAEPGYRIGLSFQNRFYIEDSPGCVKDYLLVQQRQDVNSNWTDIRRICGREPPDHINSTMPYMRLIFRSDGDVVGDGFEAKFERNCGGILYAEDDQDQHLFSPGYPTGYDRNLNCNWTIVPRDPATGGVYISFLHFDLETSPISTCLYDNLTVTTRDNEDVSSVAVLCGVKQKHEYRALESINLIFRTDRSYSGRGFQLLYSSRLCGGLVYQSGVVQSPRQHQDNSFPPNSNCYWNLTAPEGHKFIIKFEQIDFEAHSLCSYDGVEVFEGSTPDDTQRRGRFCGHIKQDVPVISIPQDRAIIHAYSDGLDKSNGFRALVRIVRNCDERVLMTAGTSTTYSKFNTPESYVNDLDCHVVFKANRDQQITLQFSSFHVEQSPDCHKDYVELRDGAGPFAELIGRFCGQDLPPKLTATRNVIFLRFVTDASVTDSGFQLQVNAVPRLCGDPLIKLESGGQQMAMLHSTPIEESNNADMQSCFWMITGDKPVNLHFMGINMEGPDANGSCTEDYLKIYNREDDEMVQKGYGTDVVFNGHISGTPAFGFAVESIYCGNSTPDTFNGNSNELFVQFRASRRNTHSSVHLQAILSSNCRRHYLALQGRIRLSQTSDCDVIVSVPQNYSLSLYYSEVEFSTFSCSVMDIEVFDRQNTSLQKVCSFMDPDKSLFTSTNYLRLHLKTGSYLTSLDVTYLASPAELGSGCGGQFYNTEGIFTNPFYPANIRNNSDCRWVVRVPSNNKVVLTFQVFNLGSRSTCLTDYLTILEQVAPGDQEQEMRRYCGDDTPRSYRSRTSQLVVRFHKTVNYDGIGWVIRFRGVNSNYE
ncbi:hypothetical protein KR018_002473, partial [Drosophila ironensis]